MGKTETFRRGLRWIAFAKTSSSAVVQTAVGRVWIILVTFGSGVLTARFLGPTGRGEQAAIAMWPQFIAFAMSFGIQSALLYQARKHAEQRDSLMSAAIVWSLLLGALATAVGVIFMPYWLSKYSSSVITFARILMIFSPLVLLGVTMNAILEVRFEFAASNLLRYGMPTVALLALVSLVALHKLTPWTSALAYTAPGTAVLVAMIPQLLRCFKFTLNDFKRSTKRLFGYGSRVYITTLLSTFGMQIDQVLVVKFLSPEMLGTYTVALSVSRMLSLLQTSLAVVIVPKASGLPDDRVARLVGCAARLNFVAAGVAAVALGLALPFLLPHIYGHDFFGSVAVSQVLIVEAVLSSTAGVLIQAFMATNRPGVPTVFQAAGLALVVPLMFALIPRFGLVGAALSLLCSTTIRLFLALASFPVLLKVPAPSLILKRSDIDFAIESFRRKAEPAEPAIEGPLDSDLR